MCTSNRSFGRVFSSSLARRRLPPRSRESRAARLPRRPRGRYPRAGRPRTRSGRASDSPLATLDALDWTLAAARRRARRTGGCRRFAGALRRRGGRDCSQHGAPYVGLVASRTRGATVKVAARGAGRPGVATLRNPAGLDLGARTAPEVALSILAEIVQVHRTSRVRETLSASRGGAVRSRGGTVCRHRPVCHMEVEIATARYKADLDGIDLLLLLRELQSLASSSSLTTICRPPVIDAVTIRARFRDRGFIIDDGVCDGAADRARAREAAAHRGTGGCRARPKPPKCSPTRSRRDSFGCSATKGSTP